MFSRNPNLHGKNAHIRTHRKHRTDLYYGVFVFLRHLVVCISLYHVLSAYDSNLLTPAGNRWSFLSPGVDLQIPVYHLIAWKFS